MPPMSDAVLDASAVLAFLNLEPGSDKVAAVSGKRIVSAVNLSEVLAKLIELGMPETEIRQVLSYLKYDIKAFETEDATLCAKLRPQTRSLGLSLGDRACLALGKKLQLPVLTADRAWSNLNLSIDIQVIR